MRVGRCESLTPSSKTRIKSLTMTERFDAACDSLSPQAQQTSSSPFGAPSRYRRLLGSFEGVKWTRSSSWRPISFLMIIRDRRVIPLYILPRPLSLTKVRAYAWLSGGRVQPSFCVREIPSHDVCFDVYRRIAESWEDSNS